MSTTLYNIQFYYCHTLPWISPPYIYNEADMYEAENVASSELEYLMLN